MLVASDALAIEYTGIRAKEEARKKEKGKKGKKKKKKKRRKKKREQGEEIKEQCHLPLQRGP